MSWAQNTYERGNRQTCSTRLRSNLIIRASDFGAALPTTTKDGVVAYPDVEPGYLIEWSAKTESDGKATSDRVTAKLIRLDTTYLTNMVNDIVATNPDIEQDAIITALSEQADPSRLFSTVSSQTVTTGSDGMAKGILPSANAPEGPAIVMIQYGYSSKSEASNAAKMWDFWSGEAMEEVITWLAAGAACASTVATGGATAALCGIAVALAVAGARLCVNYHRDAFGLIDTNKDGCTFPIGGHLHTYALAIGGEQGAVQSSSTLSPQAQQIEMRAIRRIDYGRLIMGSVLGGIAIVAIMMSMNGGDNQ